MSKYYFATAIATLAVLGLCAPEASAQRFVTIGGGNYGYSNYSPAYYGGYARPYYGGYSGYGYNTSYYPSYASGYSNYYGGGYNYAPSYYRGGFGNNYAPAYYGGGFGRGYTLNAGPISYSNFSSFGRGGFGGQTYSVGPFSYSTFGRGFRR